MTEGLELPLPEHTHAVRLASHTKTMQLLRERIIVWTDRARGSCEECLSPITREPACPVTLNGNELAEWSQQCGCGTWHGVRWTVVPGDAEDITPDEVLALAQTLRTQFDEEVEAERAEIRGWLARELRTVRTAWEAPLDPCETLEQREEHLIGGELVDDHSFAIELDEVELVASALDPTQPAVEPGGMSPDGIVVRERDLATR